VRVPEFRIEFHQFWDCGIRAIPLSKKVLVEIKKEEKKEQAAAGDPPKPGPPAI